MRPKAPDLHLAEPIPDDEKTHPETPVSKELDAALGRFAIKVLPGILAASEARITAGVINALGARLYEIESDVRRLNEGERRSGEWRLAIERRLTELERGARTRETMPSPPPAEGQ